VRGDISEDEAREEIRRRNDKTLAERRTAGRPKKTLYDEKQVIQDKPNAPTGTSTEAALRRLAKDRPDLHTRVLAGEITAHAAMVEAGFRKKAASRKRSRLDKAIALIQAMTSTERAALWKHFGIFVTRFVSE
jgi:hypothetical protein